MTAEVLDSQTEESRYALPQMPGGKDNPPWMKKGDCLSLPADMLFPSDAAGVHRAKKICENCLQQEVCLEYALEYTIDHGIWGGVSERGRRKILKERKLEAEELAEQAAE